MNVILEFPARGPSKPATQNAAGNCDVIIFPGVRIERREFNIADRVAKVRRRPAAPNNAEDLDCV